ncbi:hypothetical protein LCGC14_2035460 [marine sediment metagenome]|uniref:Uncharacterized protein n=1 Tax=marine sediment metagenome TaxID=412755 RepID=A0A0F9HQG0_9ZZZZ
MIIDTLNPIHKYLVCYDGDDKRMNSTALDLSSGMGYWNGSAVPVVRYEFVVPDEETAWKLRGQLPDPAAATVRVAGTKPEPPMRPSVPHTISYPNFVKGSSSLF